MRFQFLGAAFLSLILAGCSDVTPQVSILRNKPSMEFAPDKNIPPETNLPSVGVSNSASGYQLHAVVSKENKAIEQVSSSGYKLILDGHAD